MLAALTPQHRAAVATIFGRLAVAPDPDLNAAAQELDALLASAEKASILNLATAERSSMEALMQQQRTAFEATLGADARAQMTQHAAMMQGVVQGRSRPADAFDPGALVLRTLGTLRPAGTFGPSPM